MIIEILNEMNHSMSFSLSLIAKNLDMDEQVVSHLIEKMIDKNLIIEENLYGPGACSAACGSCSSSCPVLDSKPIKVYTISEKGLKVLEKNKEAIAN